MPPLLAVFVCINDACGNTLGFVCRDIWCFLSLIQFPFLNTGTAPTRLYIMPMPCLVLGLSITNTGVGTGQQSGPSQCPEREGAY